jgi:hypothetical protein
VHAPAECADAVPRAAAASAATATPISVRFMCRGSDGNDRGTVRLTPLC